MDTDVKKKWIAALRSGDYKQGKHYLENNFTANGSRFCCLGVLCKVLGLRTMRDTTDGEPVLESSPEPEQLKGIVPMGECRQLAMMNDLESKSFNQIADNIEAREF